MYKVLLVDDEALIREAISENTRWKELGYELMGTCKNGREAIERLDQEEADLVLTDICMPYVDGMELTRYLYEKHKGVKVIIISGYDDFEYAKTAVKYQVMDYILKPITAKELAQTLTRVKEKTGRGAFSEVGYEENPRRVYEQSADSPRPFPEQPSHGKRGSAGNPGKIKGL